MLVGPRKYQKQIIKTELKRVKNPNWPEANQLATVYKHGRGSELGGARDFSVSGFCQVFIVTRAKQKFPLHARKPSGTQGKLGATENKSSWRSERDLNSGPPNCKSGTLTTRPRCLLLKRRKTLEIFHGLLISEKVVLGSVSQVYCLAMQNLCNFEIIR